MVIESEFRPDNELHHALRAGCAQLCTNISIFNSIYSYRIVFFLDLRSHTKKVCLPQSGPRTNLHKSKLFVRIPIPMWKASKSLSAVSGKTCPTNNIKNI